MGSDPSALLAILQPAGDGAGIPRQREGVPERDRGARQLLRSADRSRTGRSLLRPRGSEHRRPRRAVDATDEYVFLIIAERNSEARSSFIYNFPYYICHLTLPLAAQF